MPLPIDHLEYGLWPQDVDRVHIYAVVDCARDDHLYPIVCGFGPQDATCLFSGDQPRELEKVSPYLVRLTYQDQATRALLLDYWGDSAFIVVHSLDSIDVTRRHLKTFLQARMPDGEVTLFRFYDPRVMRVFLPTCDAAQLEQIFGNLLAILTEDETGDHVVSWSVSSGYRLKQVVYPR
jgi:hypothetical protein